MYYKRLMLQLLHQTQLSSKQSDCSISVPLTVFTDVLDLKQNLLFDRFLLSTVSDSHAINAIIFALSVEPHATLMSPCQKYC